MRTRKMIVDYRVHGVPKHYYLEFAEWLEGVDDVTYIKLCHKVVGVNSHIDSIIELFTDLTVDELEELDASGTAPSTMPRRILYLSPEAIEATTQEIIKRKERK